MKNQINLLNQLQELVFTRDELHQAGDWSHTDALDRAIDDLRGVANDMRDIIMNDDNGLCEADMTVLKRYFGLIGGMMISMQGLDGVMTVSISEIADDLVSDLLGKGKEKV